MYIKQLVASALAIVSSSAMAQSSFEGFFGQAGIGYESTSIKFTGGTVSSANNSTYSTSANDSNNFVSSFSIGSYLAVTPNYLLGFGADYAPTMRSSETFTISIPAISYTETGSYKIISSYNIFVSPAFVIDKDKLAYVKIGKTRTDLSSVTVDSVIKKFNFTGYSLGIGYKQIIQGGLYVFGEANYKAFSKKDDGDELTGTHKLKNTDVLIGLGYKF